MSGSQTRRLIIIGVVIAAAMAVGLLKAMGPGSRRAQPGEPGVSPTTAPPASHEPVGPPVAGQTATTKPEVPGETRLPRLLDLGSTTCIPCKEMAPILEELEAEYRGRMDVEFIDIYADEAAAEKYGIMAIPTQIFFGADGKELFRHEGFYARDQILAKWQELGVDLGRAQPSHPDP